MRFKSCSVSDEMSELREAVHSRSLEKFWPFYGLFFLSGAPALLYQIVWQRALFTIYGVNIESVTIIVTMFMLGLGLGSLAGGRLSTLPGVSALRIFGVLELCIAAFGSVSLRIFHLVAAFSAGRSTWITGLVTFILLLIPTLLMGSTFPLLVAHLVRFTGNVGKSVGSLYAANTFGSGVACLVAAVFLMKRLGESGVVDAAALMNVTVGSIAVISSFLSARGHERPGSVDVDFSPRQVRTRTVPTGVGVLVSAAAGFIALGYEITWYRVYSFASGGAAPSFAKLLGFYLIGIAYGSLAVHDACQKGLRSDLDKTLRVTATVVAIGSVVAFLINPIMAWLVSSARVPLDLTYPLVSIAAALMGSILPLISHAAIDPLDRAGKAVSYLYLSNIIGSTAGSFFIGFWLMDYLSIRNVTLLLLLLGGCLSAGLILMVTPLSRRVLIGLSAACLFLALCSKPMFSHLYERLLSKEDYRPGESFREVVENRSGVITVDRNERVYGGGIYDGQFNIDPVPGANGIFRAYAIPAIHAHLHKILVIGLASGSWAQVLASYPEVEEMTVVEINPGYIRLIRERPSIAGLLENPKVHIVIDDGRRWLIAHPDRRFDFVLMNTTYNWRANSSNLLSTEFMNILREHLLPGGVAYYNTTSSGEAQLTGASDFRYALRLSNFLAVSDSPINFDRDRCRRVLTEYRVNGMRVFDLSRQEYQRALDSIVSMPYSNLERGGPYLDTSLEDRSSLLVRLKGKRLISDDNMGTEWP